MPFAVPTPPPAPSSAGPTSQTTTIISATSVDAAKATIQEKRAIPEHQRRLLFARAVEARTGTPSSKMGQRLRREVKDSAIPRPLSPLDAADAAAERRAKRNEAREKRGRPWRESKEDRRARLKREAARKFGEGCAIGEMFSHMLDDVVDAKTTCLAWREEFKARAEHAKACDRYINMPVRARQREWSEAQADLLHESILTDWIDFSGMETAVVKKLAETLEDELPREILLQLGQGVVPEGASKGWLNFSPDAPPRPQQPTPPTDAGTDLPKRATLRDHAQSAKYNEACAKVDSGLAKLRELRLKHLEKQAKWRAEREQSGVSCV